jgi:hypothetical protein
MSRGWWLGLVAAVIAAGCSDVFATRGRYRMARDLGSRYGFEYVQDTQSGKWVTRACELRVSEQRELPDPLQDNEHGTRLSVSIFKPETVESGLLLSIDYQKRDGYRVWPGAQVLDESDLAGKVAFGIQVQWFEDGKETRYDPLEVISEPPLGDTPPGHWSEWMRADRLRQGGFGWWEEAYGKEAPKVDPPKYPFEMRCQLVLKDVPGVVP